MLLVGGYPPPYGGVSVHCQRLARALEPSVEVRVLDYLCGVEPGWDPEVPFVFRAGEVHVRRRRALTILAQLRRFDCDIAHFHAGSFDNFALLALPMLAMLPRRARRLVTIHSGSFPLQVAEASPLRRRFLAAVLRRFDGVICVSQAIADTVAGLDPGVRTEVVPAFLPSVTVPDARVDAAVDALRARGVERVFVVAGFAKPYYGFQVVLDALEADPSLRERVGVVFAFYSYFDEPYYSETLERASRLGVASFDDLTPEQFAHLLSRSDGFVRPTDRDGDSIAIREARMLGKQVLASDCVRRPEGTLLFETFSAASLGQALRAALDDASAGTGAESADANWQALSDVYRSVGIAVR